MIALSFLSAHALSETSFYGGGPGFGGFGYGGGFPGPYGPPGFGGPGIGGPGFGGTGIGGPGYGGSGFGGPGFYGGPPSSYQFGYGVQIADPFFGPADFSRSEERLGHVTNGNYQINQPTSFQRVSFSVAPGLGPIPVYG